MYRSFDEEVFLAPESVVAGVVATAAFADELELPDVGRYDGFRDGDPAIGEPDADADFEADAGGVRPHVDETSPFRAESEWIDGWARRAFAANGFGG